MSEIDERFTNLAGRMVPVFKKLALLESRGLRVDRLLNFLMDSDYDPDWWLTVPVPITIKLSVSEKFQHIGHFWADERYLVLKFHTTGTFSQERVLIYDSKTGFYNFLPSDQCGRVSGCYLPLVCADNIFILYFDGKQGYLSCRWTLAYLVSGDEGKYPFDNLGYLKAFWKDTNNCKFLSANDRKRVVAFIERVIQKKEDPKIGWMEMYRASSSFPYVINAGDICWKVFEVKDPKGQMVFYIQKTVK